MHTVFNVMDFGAVGDGYADDTKAIQDTVDAALQKNGGVMIPPGMYLITREIVVPKSQARITVFGCGANTSLIYAQNCGGFNFEFEQNGAQQPFGAVIRELGFHALGVCPTAIRVSYGYPPITNDHNQPSVTLSDIQIVSDPEGHWCNGIDIESAWNPTLENCFVSGDSCGGNWNAMHGAGVALHGSCVNAHLSNVRCNFWAEGLSIHSSHDRNTEGIYCSNCSMVAVKRGVHLCGAASVAAAPRISTLIWTGGLIECRVGGVEGGCAAFDMKNVWTVLITGCQMITETISTNVENTYAVSLNNCRGVVVNGCDMNAWIFGVATSGVCIAISTHGNTFTNCATQTVFNPDTSRSRSYGHTLVNDEPDEMDFAGVNKIGFVN